MVQRAKRLTLTPLRYTTALLALVATLATGGALAQSARSPAISADQWPVRFAILSDLHLYDMRLGVGGTAWEAYLAQDPKLLVESDAILDSVVEGVLQAHVKFVIVTGDMTKDGELRDHVFAVQHLAKLEQHGIPVFVVPGNHDINNPDAVRYVGDTTQPVPGTTPELFRAIYQRFGYGGRAVDRDTNSLSYVVEPVRGLWLLAVDTCKYDESKQLGYPVVSGRIRPETMVWIQGVMQRAHAQGKQVIAFMHHGVNQHFFGEAQLFSDYLLDDWVNVSFALAQTGLKVVFTGHYHSQDSSYLVDADRNPLSPLVDVETGSLVTYPCAYRVATLDSQNMLHVESRRVTSINFDTGGVPFQEYASNVIYGATVPIVTGSLTNMFPIPYDQAAAVAPYVAQGLIANYAGDENPSPETLTLIDQWLGSPEPLHTLGLFLLGFWTDLPPADNELFLSIDIE